jgi:hypothetical protein
MYFLNILKRAPHCRIASSRLAVLRAIQAKKIPRKPSQRFRGAESGGMMAHENL